MLIEFISNKLVYNFRVRDILKLLTNLLIEDLN